MAARLREQSLDGLRMREKIARAVRVRIEASEDREAVRRGMTLFSLPIYSADGVRALWSTSDAIWRALGDSSDDLNWYSKRATLAGVYSSTVLYWLGDDSPESRETWDFLDRRIDDVMRIESAKSGLRKLPFMGTLMDLPNRVAARAAPRRRDEDIPGSWPPADTPAAR